MLVAALVAASVAGCSPGVALAIFEPAPSHDNSPRQVGGPTSFALTVARAEAAGAVVTTKEGVPNSIGLVVARLVGEGGYIVGHVPLGPTTIGFHSIPWDLRVNGQRLSPGRYQINLGIFTPAGQPTGYPPAPDVAVLSIAPSGSVSVTMQREGASGSSGSGLSAWIAVLIGLGALLVGLLIGFGVLRRKKPPAASIAA